MQQTGTTQCSGRVIERMHRGTSIAAPLTSLAQCPCRLTTVHVRKPDAPESGLCSYSAHPASQQPKGATPTYGKQTSSTTPPSRAKTGHMPWAIQLLSCGQLGLTHITDVRPATNIRQPTNIHQPHSHPTATAYSKLCFHHLLAALWCAGRPGELTLGFAAILSLSASHAMTPVSAAMPR